MFSQVPFQVGQCNGGVMQCHAAVWHTLRRYQRHENAIARVVSTMTTAALHRQLNRSASDPVFIAIELERNQVAQQAEIALFFNMWLGIEVGS